SGQAWRGRQAGRRRRAQRRGRANVSIFGSFTASTVRGTWPRSDGKASPVGRPADRLKLRMSGFRTIESSCSCPGPLLQCTANAARGGGRAMELTPLATIALIACAVVLIYAFVWWLTRTISRRVRAVVRSAVVLITGVALGIGLLLNFQMISRDFAIPPQGEEQQVGAEPADRDQQTATKPDASDEERTARHESEQPTWRSGRRSLPEALPETGADPSAGDAPAKRNGMEPMATPPPADSEWDVVPVFYGTDRGRIENAERVDYGSDRGRRLQLGHALVTVPRIHQVPQIERPWVYRIPFTQIVIWEEAEDPRKHLTLKEIR